MINQRYEVHEFKYSINKVLIRIGLGAILAISGGLAFYRLEKYFDRQKRNQLFENIRNGIHAIPEYPIWVQIVLAITFIVFLIGGYILFDIHKLFRKRVFLRLTYSGLQHNELELWIAPFIRFPHIKESFFAWNDILDARIKQSILFGNSIVLTFFEKKKGRNRTHDISTVNSEYDAEYILQTIRKNMPDKNGGTFR